MRRAAHALFTGLAVLCLGTAVFAAQEHIDLIKAQCGPKLGMADEACVCIADMAAKLTSNQQQLVAAMVMKDVATASRIQADMPLSDLSAAGRFMASVPMQCKG